jgi:hypothetical protein
VCISDLIFPRGEGTTVEPFATGDGSFDRIEAWHLESVWPVAEGERLPSAASHGQ